MSDEQHIEALAEEFGAVRTMWGPSNTQLAHLAFGTLRSLGWCPPGEVPQWMEPVEKVKRLEPNGKFEWVQLYRLKNSPDSADDFIDYELARAERQWDRTVRQALLLQGMGAGVILSGAIAIVLILVLS